MCRPIRVKVHKGLEYFITYIDDYSIVGYIHLMTHKYEALKQLKEFNKTVETQLRGPIKDTDRCSEYEFNDLCKGNS